MNTPSRQPDADPADPADPDPVPLAPPLLMDTTLRDGAQAPGVTFDRDTRVALARRLAEFGVGEMETGVPASGAEAVAEMRAVAAAVPGLRTSAWCRARDEDLDAAAASGCDWVHLSLPVSDIHLAALGKTPGWLAEVLARLMPTARDRFAGISIGLQDASRAPLERLVTLARALEGHIDRLRLADTVGTWMPWETAAAIARVRAAAPGLTIGFHGHNDFGLATANALSAWQAGADHLDVTVLGLGERAGNAALEQVAAAIATRCPAPWRLETVNALCQAVAAAAGEALPLRRPLVGEQVFRHESGVHVQAMLRDRRAYEPLPPETVGHAPSELVVGANSGRAGLRYACRRHGIALDPNRERRALARVRSRARQAGRWLTVAELRSCCELAS